MMRPESQVATCRNLSVSEKRHCFSNVHFVLTRQCEHYIAGGEMQAILMQDRRLVEQDKRITALEDNTLISTRQRRKIRNAIHSSVASACGGIKTVAYKENSKRVYKAVYNFLYDHYDISEYADIPKVKYNEALSLIENWYPSYDLQLSIDISNNCKQQKMDLDED